MFFERRAMIPTKSKRSWLLARLRQLTQSLTERLRARRRGGRHSMRPTRIVRKLLAMWRARRRH